MRVRYLGPEDPLEEANISSLFRSENSSLTTPDICIIPWALSASSWVFAKVSSIVLMKEDTGIRMRSMMDMLINIAKTAIN